MDLSKLTYPELLAIRVELNNTIAKVETVVKAKLDDGEYVRGFALKAGRKTRTLKNAVALAALFKEEAGIDLYEKKLVGIPAIEKIIKDNFDAEGAEFFRIELAACITESFSKPTMVYVGESDE